MFVLQQIVTDPEPCPYLPERECRMEYSYTPLLTPEEYEERMNQGYRKFGAVLFRPVCAECRACRPLRIPVESFRPNRSQRRAWAANAHLEVRRARPTVDSPRLELYQRYHLAQAERKGWSEQSRDAREYARSYVQNPLPAVEVSLWEADRLRAVLLTEVTEQVISGIYHYYDPELREQGLGTCCMLHTIELARALGRPYAYFGYYVAGCPSLEYKARFRPCETLGEDGNWAPFEG